MDLVDTYVAECMQALAHFSRARPAASSASGIRMRACGKLAPREELDGVRWDAGLMRVSLSRSMISRL